MAKRKTGTAVAEPDEVAAEVAATNGNGHRKPMGDGHKAALAEGREAGRAIRRYLEALEAQPVSRRGRKRSTESMEKRLATIDATITTVDPLTRLHMVQERMDLQAQLGRAAEPVDISDLEDDFVQHVATYSARKGLTWAAWREAGIDAQVLRRAGLSRSSRS